MVVSSKAKGNVISDCECTSIKQSITSETIYYYQIFKYQNFKEDCHL